MLFIYWLEDNPEFADRVGQIHQRMTDRGDQLCTSAFTLGELLVGPKKKGDLQLEKTIDRFFNSSEIEVLPFTASVAQRYASIRSENKVSPADAMHLATAASANVDLFLTNDLEVRKLVIQGIRFIDGLDTGALGPQ